VVDFVSDLRAAAAAVAEQARHVSIDRAAIPQYAAGLPSRLVAAPPDAQAHLTTGSREQLAAFWVTLNAINFGSGWFPTLRKRGGRSGYFTIASGVRTQFAERGGWSAAELARIDAGEVATVLDEDPDHELMSQFADSLRDLGGHVAGEYSGRFAAIVDRAQGSAVALAAQLGSWRCFADISTYGRLVLPFLKRAQLAAADLARAGVVELHDRPCLTIFADNLVPHVLRLDGVLRFESSLLARVERGELIEHRSPEEVEIRACALHAVELIVDARSDSCAADVDQLLWLRGQEPRYKASPRHRARCTAY
jgi:hypothetical protein